MKISNIIQGKPVLAPMAGVTNLAFRILCRRYGAALVCTEMINANALARNNRATIRLTETAKEEKPVLFQLFGTKEENFIRAIEFIENKADIIDINMGCSVRKIIKQGAGSALLKRPEKIKRLVEAVAGVTKRPVGAKIRISDLKTTIKTAKIIQNAGASVLTIHGRTPEQGYSGKADWDIIRAVKKGVSIPIIGNGDIIDEDSAMLHENDADYLMIGRAAIGNPFIFARINHFLKTGERLEQKSKAELFREYYSLTLEYPVREADFKTQALWFTKGLNNSAKLREEISNSKTQEEIFNLFSSI